MTRCNIVRAWWACGHGSEYGKYTEYRTSRKEHERGERAEYMIHTMICESDMHEARGTREERVWSLAVSWVPIILRRRPGRPARGCGRAVMLASISCSKTTRLGLGVCPGEGSRRTTA